MPFTAFPRHSKYGQSCWKRQVVLHKSLMDIDAQKDALEERRALQVKLDPSLYLRLQEESIFTGDDGEKSGKNSGSSLKSSLRQVVSAPTSPQHGPSKSSKSVKFDPFHLEKVCFFEGSHSPSKVPRLEENKYPPFKVLYSHWPPIQHTLFQPPQNVQLKRSLKVLEGGSILKGQVMVRNLGYEKQIEIRYTLDGWQTVNNTQATYLNSRGSLDTFVYELDIERGMADRGHVRVTVDMAVRYTVKVVNKDRLSNHSCHYDSEETFWDNNDGHNYQVQVIETPITPPLTSLASSSLAASIPDSFQLDHELGQIDINTDHDHNDDVLPVPIKLPSSSTTSSHRYDFGQSILKAKRSTRVASVPCSSPPTLAKTIDINEKGPSPPSSPPPQRKSQSAPSSPESSSFVDYLHSPDESSISSLSYTDLVNKYCFYGSQPDSPSSPALSING